MVRHLTSIKDLTPSELQKLVSRGLEFKKQFRAGDYSGSRPLAGQLVALLFSKRSTRTRVSTEGAVAYLGASPMFLGKDDIQLGVNESFYDTTKVLSSMTSAIVARVGPHSEIQELVKHSRVPIINALCEKYHPTQAIADLITIKEAFGTLDGLKLSWVGDANNVLHDLAIACVKVGINVAVATPASHQLSREMLAEIESNSSAATVEETTDPLEAVKDADIIVTDTWVSMGQEEEKAKRLKEFEGFQVSDEMAQKGGAKKDWKFMHCLPRHSEEVTDEVFYSDRSVVFEEAENRLYSALAVLEAFVVNKGQIN